MHFTAEFGSHECARMKVPRNHTQNEKSSNIQGTSDPRGGINWPKSIIARVQESRFGVVGSVNRPPVGLTFAVKISQTYVIHTIAPPKMAAKQRWTENDYMFERWTDRG